MKTKLFEIRDRGTFLPAIATELSRFDGYLTLRAGYCFSSCILLGRLTGGTFCYDIYDWEDRTMHTAHEYIRDNWENLESGDVIDVQFILGETETICIRQEEERI